MLEEQLNNNGEYLENLAPELKELFFYELSKYSAGQLASYFIEGVTRYNRQEPTAVFLPQEEDNRKELVHHYLLSLPESFVKDFRRHLDYELKFNLEADPIFFPSQDDR